MGVMEHLRFNKTEGKFDMVDRKMYPFGTCKRILFGNNTIDRYSDTVKDNNIEEFIAA